MTQVGPLSVSPYFLQYLPFVFVLEHHSCNNLHNTESLIDSGCRFHKCHGNQLHERSSCLIGYSLSVLHEVHILRLLVACHKRCLASKKRGGGRLYSENNEESTPREIHHQRLFHREYCSQIHLHVQMCMCVYNIMYVYVHACACVPTSATYPSDGPFETKRYNISCGHIHHPIKQFILGVRIRYQVALVINGL